MPMVKRFTQSFLEIQPYDPGTDRLQCIECGKWLKHIAWLHLRTHGMSVAEYKEKHGINRNHGLTCNEMYLRRVEQGHEYGKKHLQRNKGGTGGMRIEKRKQAVADSMPTLKANAETIKKNWLDGKYEYLRDHRRSLAIERHKTDPLFGARK